MREIELNTNEMDWVPTKWEGVYRKMLRNEADGGAFATLLKFDAGSSMPMHMHPAGEEVFVLEGRIRFEQSWYEGGFYLYSPPGSSDDVYSDTGATLFVTLPRAAIHPE